MIDALIGSAQTKMDKAIESLKNNLSKLRTGRAHPSLLDQVMVSYYGQDVPLSQVANVGTQDSRTLSITPWEKDMVSAIEKAIMTSNLGLNPMSAGTVIHVPLPPLTEERRKDMAKLVGQEAETIRISVRSIRRDVNQKLKDALKNKEVAEDEVRKAEDRIQKITDQFIQKIADISSEKEKDIMEV